MTCRVVVTGIGAVSPLGVGAHALHERWCAGANGIVDGEAPCADFNPTDHMGSKEARRADRFTQLAIAAADEALADAGWGQEDLPYDPQRIACVIGTGVGGLGTIEANHTKLGERGEAGVSPLAIPLLMNNAATAGVALRRGFTGPSYTVGSACAAGAHAIGNALMLLRAGAVDAVVTGGSEAALTPLARAAFGRLEALSPTGVSRPFDARRDGFVMGEGAGVLVLETAEGAEARGARALATLRGFGTTSDAHHLTAPRPDGAGAAAAIRAALADAEATPADVDYVNAHGTSTPLNDRAESLALEAALGERAMEIPVSSTKSAIGHLLGAAGAVEAVATVLALRDRVAPPTLGFEQREIGLDLDYVPGRARPLAIAPDRKPLAISNSFGFGGHNAVVCLQAA
jgi:3-oxoacyl-[acyl-carrier-protein] synthase II